MVRGRIYTVPLHHHSLAWPDLTQMEGSGPLPNIVPYIQHIDSQLSVCQLLLFLIIAMRAMHDSQVTTIHLESLSHCISDGYHCSYMCTSLLYSAGLWSVLRLHHYSMLVGDSYSQGRLHHIMASTSMHSGWVTLLPLDW